MIMVTLRTMVAKSLWLFGAYSYLRDHSESHYEFCEADSEGEHGLSGGCLPELGEHIQQRTDE